MPKNPKRLMTKTTHRHKHRLLGANSKEITFKCTTCGDQKSRPITAKERKVTGMDELFDRKLSIHRVWHAFSKKFMKGGSFKLKGYDLMKAVEKWAKKYPRDVRTVGIDDGDFCNSDLVLVDHKTKDQYMGVTAVVIPQCTGEDPLCFFMYPSHQAGLLKALVALEKAAKPVKKRQSQREKARRKEFDKLRF